MSLKVSMAYLCVCAQSCLTLYNLMDYTHQASLSMVLYQRGIQSRLPFPPAGDLPKQGIRPDLLHWQVESLH